MMNSFNEKYINSKNISRKSKSVFHSILLKSYENKKYKAFVVDIVNKNQNFKNKKAGLSILEKDFLDRVQAMRYITYDAGLPQRWLIK